MPDVNLPGGIFLLSNNALLGIVRNCFYQKHTDTHEIRNICDQCAILYAERLEEVISDIEELRSE